MTALLLSLVALVAIQTPLEAASEPVPIVDGVPTESEILAKLSLATPGPRSFEAVWQEGPSLQRPAILAWRLRAIVGQRVTLETFDMSAATQVVHRYGDETRGETRPLSHAPTWIQWLMGGDPRELVKRLPIDASRRALDVVNKRVLWVLGARADQDDRVQVRVDRETGSLRRIVERRLGAEGGRLLDVSLLERAARGPTPWLPARLIVLEGKKRSTLHLVSSSVIPADRSAEP